VAWGFTNSYGDWQDLVVVERDPADPERYLAPGGPRRFEHVSEVMKVKGGAEERLDVVLTMWGPIVGRDHLGRPRAMRWTAHDPAAVNLELVRLEDASSVGEALDDANASGIPPQNFVCADRGGHIGWTVAGVLPRRVGFDGRLPTSWADGTRRWDGWRAPRETPRIVDPPGGILWTANARVVEGAELELIGDGGYALGARAGQIRDDLRARDRWGERDLLAVQLDDRALFLSRWRTLLLEVLRPDRSGSARRAEAWRLVNDWGGRASVNSAGYRIVHDFRRGVLARVLEPFAAEARRRDGLFEEAHLLLSAEGPVWRLLETRPPHLLDPRYASWNELLLGAADEATSAGRGGLASRTWGEHNTVTIRHPLSSAIPLIGDLLDLSPVQLPGDDHMPRVQTPWYGASERLVVSPGREADGIFEMPGGQGGNPLSPYYRAGHEAWVRGDPAPFSPGPTAHRLTLVPR